MLTPMFNWTTPDGVTRTACVNNGAFLSIEDFIYGWQDTTDNPIGFVFISLTSIRIFQQSLDAIKGFVADDVLVFVDASTGILLENMVHRSFTQLICLSTFATGTQVVFSDKEAGFRCTHSEVLLEIGYTGTAWSQLKHNKELDFQYHHVLRQVLNNLSNNVVKVSVVSKTGDTDHFHFHCKLWSHYLGICLDLLSIAYGTSTCTNLLSGESNNGSYQLLAAFPTQYVFRNMLNDLQSLMIQVSGVKVSAELFGSSKDILNCNMVKMWARKITLDRYPNFLATHGSYALLLIYQMILISDETSLRCSTFEFVYAQLCHQLCSPGRLKPLPMWLRNGTHSTPVRFDEILQHTSGWYHLTNCRAFRFLEEASTSQVPQVLRHPQTQGIQDRVQNLAEAPGNSQPPVSLEIPYSGLPPEQESACLDNGSQSNERQTEDQDANMAEFAIYYDAIQAFADAPQVKYGDSSQELLELTDVSVTEPDLHDDVPLTVEGNHDTNESPRNAVQLLLPQSYLIEPPREKDLSLLALNYGEHPRLSCSERDIYLRRGSRWFSDELYNVDIDDQLFCVLNVEDNEDLIEHATLANSRFPGPISESRKLDSYSRKLQPYLRRKGASGNHESRSTKTQANIWRESFLNAVRRRDILWSTRDQYGIVTDPGSVPPTLMRVVDLL